MALSPLLADQPLDEKFRLVATKASNGNPAMRYVVVGGQYAASKQFLDDLLGGRSEEIQEQVLNTLLEIQDGPFTTEALVRTTRGLFESLFEDEETALETIAQETQ